MSGRRVCPAARRRRAVGLTWAVLLAALLAGGATAALAGPPPMQEPLPPPPVRAGLDRPLYDEVPLEQYSVDADYSYSDTAARQVHLLLANAMAVRAWLVKLAIRMAEQALTLRPAVTLAAAADQVTAQIGDALWGPNWGGPLVLAALVCAGIWATLLWFRRPGTAWRSLLGTGAVLAIAVAALLNLGAILRGLEAVSGDLARAAFAAATRPIAGEGNDPPELRAITAAGAAAWDALVHRPWLDAEFTDASAAAQYAARTIPGLALLLKPADERLQLYTALPLYQRERLFAPWQINRLPGRALTVLAASLAAAIYALAVLVLAGMVLVYDLLLVALAALTPAAALLALWPPWGRRLAAAWASRLLGAALAKVFYALALGVFFSLSVALFPVARPGGWPLAALLQAGLALAIWRARLQVPRAAAALAAGVAPAPGTRCMGPGAVAYTRSGRPEGSLAGRAGVLAGAASTAHRPARAVVDGVAAAPVAARPASVLVPVVSLPGVQPRQEFAMEMTRLRQQIWLATLREGTGPRRPSLARRSPAHAAPGPGSHTTPLVADAGRVGSVALPTPGARDETPGRAALPGAWRPSGELGPARPRKISPG